MGKLSFKNAFFFPASEEGHIPLRLPLSKSVEHGALDTYFTAGGREEGERSSPGSAPGTQSGLFSEKYSVMSLKCANEYIMPYGS